MENETQKQPQPSLTKVWDELGQIDQDVQRSIDAMNADIDSAFSY